MKFWQGLLFFASGGKYRKIVIKKYYIVRKLDHLTCSKFVFTTSLYNPTKLVKLKFVFSPDLHYMANDLTFQL